MAFGVNPDPDRKLSVGQRLDVELELADQSFEAISNMLEEHKDRIGALENTVALLEALVLGTGKGAAA